MYRRNSTALLSGLTVAVVVLGQPSFGQRTEKIVRSTTAADLSAADIAIRKAMELDPSYASGTGNGLSRDAAVAAWRELLDRANLIQEQQIFAWWRIGSLYAYNMDRSRGEAPDYKEAELAFAKIRALAPNLVSLETLNSATISGTLPGTPEDRMRRLSANLKWIAALNPTDIDNSALRINRLGYIVDAKFFPGGANMESSVDERKQLLQDRVAEHKQLLVERITEYIQYNKEPTMVGKLLESVKDVADARQMDRWRVLHRQLEARSRNN
jgi:hypothetical protein